MQIVFEVEIMCRDNETNNKYKYATFKFRDTAKVKFYSGCGSIEIYISRHEILVVI